MRERLRAVKQRAAQLLPKRENVAVGVLILTLVVSGVSVAQESSIVTATDDFEDGNADGWSGDEIQVVEDSTEGTYSLYQEDGYPNFADSATWDAGPTIDLGEEFEVNGTIRSDQGSFNNRVRIGLVDNNDEGAMLIFSRAEDATYLADDGADPEPASSIPDDFDNVWVNFEIRSDGNGTLQAKVWQVGSTEPSSYQISQSFDSDLSGPIRMVPGVNDGVGRRMWLDSIRVQGTQTIPDDVGLTLKHDRYIEHGNSVPYTVVYDENTSDYQAGVNVTQEANVTTDMPSVVSVQGLSLVATSNESVAQRVNTTATYTTANGTVLTDSSYATVANVTVENLEILPPIYRYSAVLGDDTVFFLIVSTLTSIIGTRFTTAFGGISLYWIVVMIGWLSGWLSLGVLLLATVMCLFMGLNLAANIDYGSADRIVRTVR